MRKGKRTFEAIAKEFENFAYRNYNIGKCRCQAKFRSPAFVSPVFCVTRNDGITDHFKLGLPCAEHVALFRRDCDPKVELCTDCFGFINAKCECRSHPILNIKKPELSD